MRTIAAMPSLAAPFADVEFRAIWTTRGLSLLGDQLARVALAVLVFQRTGSAAWTGAAYAASFLPYLVGPSFAGVADRRPRKGILVSLDLARATAIGAMALPGMPLLWMCALLALVTAASPVYDAARSAMLPEILTDGRYPTGLAICSITTESAQVLGFACGGILVAALGARATLAVDAATFLGSALILARWIQPRPPARARSNDRSGHLRSTTRLVLRGPRLRRLLALAWMNAFWIVPEGLAAPYAHRLGGGPVAVGLLLSALPLGCALGAVVLTSFVSPDRRLRLMMPMAIGAGLPLAACAFHPGLAWSMALWGLCGVGSAYNVAANAAFVEEVPNACRSQAIAIVTTGMVAGQGLAVLLGGLAASLVAPWFVVSGAGLLGVATAAAVSVSQQERSGVIDLTGPIPVAVDH
jgi:MFS family permease